MSLPRKPRPGGNTREQIRRLAMRAALILPLVGMACGLCLGRGPLESFLNSTAAAVVGFAAWNVYHRTSGRNDGLLFAGMPLSLALSNMREPNPQLLKTLFVSLVAYLPIAWLMGRWNRGLAKAKDGKPSVQDPDGFGGTIASD